MWESRIMERWWKRHRDWPWTKWCLDCHHRAMEPLSRSLNCVRENLRQGWRTQCQTCCRRRSCLTTSRRPRCTPRRSSGRRRPSGGQREAPFEWVVRGDQTRQVSRRREADPQAHHGFQSHKLCDSYPDWGRPDLEWFTGPATCRPSPGPSFAFVCWWFGVGLLPVCLAGWVVEADVLLWQGELEVAGVWKRRSGLCGGNCTPHGLGLCCGGSSTCPQEAGIEESFGWRSRTVGLMRDQAGQPFPWPRSRRATLEPLLGRHKSVGDPGEEGGCWTRRQSARRTRAATQGLSPLGHPGVPEQVPAASLERWKAWGCPWWGQGLAEGGNPTSPWEHILGAVDFAAGVCTQEGFASAAGAWSPHDAIQKTDFRCFWLPLEGDQWWCGDVGLGIKILRGDLSSSHESAPACHWPAVKDSRCGHSLGCQWDRWWSGVWWKADQPGIQEAYMVEEDLDELPIEAPCLDTPQVILVFDFFAGIGGLSRALQLAKVKVDRLVVVEKDPDCRRLNAVRWPGCDVWSDIEKLAKKDIERMMRSVPGITGVVAAGGSPCQGLSKLSCDRKHLEDPRSKLFYCYSAVLGWIEEVAEEMQIWSLLALENVLGDDEDVTEMTGVLGSKPVLACSSGLSRVRRPRLYWSNIRIEDHGSYTRAHYGLYDELIFEEAPEPMEAGWHWPGGVADEELRLPTFTRAIPRRRPPAQPAGLSSCDAETVKRWQKDRMKFPRTPIRRSFCLPRKALTGVNEWPAWGSAKGWWASQQDIRGPCTRRSPQTKLRRYSRRWTERLQLGTASILSLWHAWLTCGFGQCKYALTPSGPRPLSKGGTRRWALRSMTAMVCLK